MQTPRYEYSKSQLKDTAKFLKSIKAPYGLNVKYAMKANPHPEIIRIFDKAGLGFDASSSYEAQELIDQGVKGSKVSLSSQQSAHNLQELIDAGVKYIATSKRQLNDFLKLENHPKSIGIRINPGVGSGYYKRFTTGGLGASFGIWHEYLDEIMEITDEADVKIEAIQIHIGTAGNPDVWARVAQESLQLVEKMPDVKTLNLGGGFKTIYHPDDEEADIESIIGAISDKVEDFYNDHERKIELEIEPGRFLVAHAGKLVAEIDDIVDTGKGGYQFIRLNTGMNDFLRTAMYGAYHRIEVINDEKVQSRYVVVGHNCETSDTLSCERDDPELIASRLLNVAHIGDEVVIHDTGAYCANMSAKGYNSYPDAVEVMVD